MRIGMRSIGGLAGAAAALAGGIGPAAGFYSLPDPMGAGVGQGAYGRADERAIAVWRQDNGDGTFREVRVDAGRGGSAGEDIGAGGAFPNLRGEQNAGVHFHISNYSCYYDGECFENEEHSELDPGLVSFSFEIDPLLRNATLSVFVDDCQFDVVWTGEGEVAPFTGLPHSNAGVNPWNARVETDNGYAETSRVAPAQITACFGSFANVNGYLSRGMRRLNADAGGGSGG